MVPEPNFHRARLERRFSSSAQESSFLPAIWCRSAPGPLLYLADTNCPSPPGSSGHPSYGNVLRSSELGFELHRTYCPLLLLLLSATVLVRALNQLNTMISPIYSRATFALMLFSFLFLTACKDNPVGSDDHDDDHAEANGIELVRDGNVIYRVQEGVVSCDASPCGIFLQPGQATSDLEVHFIDADGDEMHAEDLEEGFTMSFSVDSPGVALVEQTGDWTIRVTGIVSGQSRLQINLEHNGHVDLTTPPVSDANAIAITVSAG